MEEPILDAPTLFFSYQALFGHVFPFVGFYIGIHIRHTLRESIFKEDLLSLKELWAAGLLFSLLAVAPLLPAFRIAADNGRVDTYLLTLAVVIQAGLFMPESLARVIDRRSRQDQPTDEDLVAARSNTTPTD